MASDEGSPVLFCKRLKALFEATESPLHLLAPVADLGVFFADAPRGAGDVGTPGNQNI